MSTYSSSDPPEHAIASGYVRNYKVFSVALAATSSGHVRDILTPLSAGTQVGSFFPAYLASKDSSRRQTTMM